MAGTRLAERTTQGHGGQAAAALREARHLTEPVLRSALDRLDPDTRRVCGYHLGYCDADGRPAPGGAGKGVRAALALLSARAGGGTDELGVPAAVACELVHNFSLLHDDVMDGDVTRRHRPTVWALFGSSAAILAGDALLGLAHEVLCEAPSATVPRAVHDLSATTRRLVAGQSADLAFERADTVSLAQYLEMAAGKTGALLACSASLGAVLAGAPAPLCQGLADYGAHLGLAFQLSDDLLGIWGYAEHTGKPVGSDLRSRKRSGPVVAALESRTAAGSELARLYAVRRELEACEREQAAVLVERAGGRATTDELVTRESAAAVATLEGLRLSAGVHARLVALTEMLSRRRD